MSAIQIQGMRPLFGTVEIQGSKNAVLPLMAAAVLAPGVTVIRHVPAIEDVITMMKILEALGCPCSLGDGTLTIDAKDPDGIGIPEKYVGKMRSSCLLLGPLLSRMGEAVTYFPGGCVIGARPIDFHIHALEQMGAVFFEAGGMILAGTGGLKGSEIRFPYPSVGATENALMAAVLAEGTTVLDNCAAEPEIAELCRFLTKMGAKIHGTGEKRLVIEGVKELTPTEFFLTGDRICAGTYLAAACAAGGEVTVRGVDPWVLKEPLRVMRQMGAAITTREETQEILLTMERRPAGFRVCTGPYPEFPTDLQSVFLAVASAAEGRSRITETVFEARFAAAAVMERFGARIRAEGRTLFVEGRYPLKPSIADAPDLRGGAALLVAAMAADGRSMIGNCEHIARGYEDIVRDLVSLGAEAEWIRI